MSMTKDNPTAIASSMALKGVQLCSDVIPAPNRVECLLMSSRDVITSEEIKNALKAAAPPYRSLITFYNELLAIYKHNSSQAGGPGVKLKPLAL